MLQLFDKKTECGKFFSQVFEFAGDRDKVGLGKFLDDLAAFPEHGIGAFLAQHGERTFNLADRLCEHRQRGMLGRIAEKRVQRLLNDTQVGADFAGDGFKQQPFLRAPRHGVEHRHVEYAELFAAPQGIQPAGQRFGLGGKIFVKGVKKFECRFGQQQGGGHFKRQHIGVSRGVTAQQVGDDQNGCRESPIGALPGVRPFLGNFGDAFVKRYQCGGGAGTQAVPVFFGTRQQIAQATDAGQQALGIVRRARRNHAFETVSRTHDGHVFATRAGTGHQIQRFAQQVLGYFGVAFDQFFDLGTQTHGELFGLRCVIESVSGEGVQRAQRNPPVGACGRGDARFFDHGDRDFHLADALGIIFDPLQQTALEAHAGNLESCSQRTGIQWCNVLLAFRRPLGHIGEKQFHRRRRGQAARFSHGAICRQQTQRLVRVSGHEIIEIGAQRGQRSLCGGDGSVGAGRAGDDGGQ